MRKKILAAGFVASTVVFSFYFWLQPRSAMAKDTDYPTKPINFIITYAAGGTTDLSCRATITAANKHLPQPIVPINKPGGGGTVAAMAVANSEPDGYTIGDGSSTQMFVAPFSPGNPYTNLDSFTVIAGIGRYTHASMVRSDAPWKTWKELIDWVKQHPGQMKVGLGGARSVNYSGIILSQVEEREKIRFTYVPFKSGIEAVTAVLGGHIGMTATTIDASVMEFVKTGKIRILAFQDKTIKGFETTPTLREFHHIDIIPNLQTIWGPRGISDPIVVRLEQAFALAVKDPIVIKAYESFYMPINFMDRAGVNKSVESSLKLAEKIIKGLQAEEKKEKK